MTCKEKEVFPVCRPADDLSDGVKKIPKRFTGFFSALFNRKKTTPVKERW